jgi:hypothetical protein
MFLVNHPTDGAIVFYLKVMDMERGLKRFPKLHLSLERGQGIGRLLTFPRILPDCFCPPIVLGTLAAAILYLLLAAGKTCCGAVKQE